MTFREVEPGEAPPRPRALVTGASRGIGKASAVALAANGFDVALAARTVRPGEPREHSLTRHRSDSSPLPGSLEETAALVAEHGGQALVVPMDLLDQASVRAGLDQVLSAWDGVDVLVNNGRYVGPGHGDRFLDTPVELIERQLRANVVAPLVLAQGVLAHMAGRGQVRLVQVSSSTGTRDPQRPVGEGGWGMGYGTSKGAFHRIAGVIAAEVPAHDALVFNVMPGTTATERLLVDGANLGFDPSQGWAAPKVIGEVVAWLATSAEAAELHGTAVDAQAFHRDRLAPSPPDPGTAPAPGS